MSNDDDFLMHLSEECVQIQDFMFDSKSKKLVSIKFSFASNEVANLWLRHVSETSESKLSVIADEFPFFMHDDLRT